LVVIQGTASEAGVVALLAGRSRALAGRPPEDHQRLVAYTSDQVCRWGGQARVTVASGSGSVSEPGQGQRQGRETSLSGALARLQTQPTSEHKGAGILT
jgi:hypothetical protein